MMEIMDAQVEQYVNRYSRFSDSKLRSTLACLEGQPVDHPTALKQAQAVRAIMERRKGGAPIAVPAEEGSPEEMPRPQTDEEYIAFKYLAKSANARDRGIEFTLSISDMRRLIKRKRCAYTGVRMLDNVHQRHPQKRTIDRIDASLGYTKDNVVACTFAANSLKNIIFEIEDSNNAMSTKALQRFANSMAKIGCLKS